MIGYTLICYGCLDALFCIISSYLVKKIGRLSVLLMATLVNAIVIVAFLTWKPNPDYKITFFVIAGLWGLSDGVWHSQNAGIISICFQKTLWQRHFRFALYTTRQNFIANANLLSSLAELCKVVIKFHNFSIKISV